MKKLFPLPLALAMAWPLLAATKIATFNVTGWQSGSCAAATRLALKNLGGVEDVQTDLEKSEATVTYDDTKVAPERMIQAIEKLGYRAGPKAAAQPPAGSHFSEKDIPTASAASPERVSFFEVPLECGASEGLGCGSASKPILKKLDRTPGIKEAKINSSGTVLAVAWSDTEQARSGAATVEAIFKARGLETALLRNAARQKALAEFESGRWYGESEVDLLSEREAQVIATRLTNRAKARFGLSPEKLSALTRDLTSGIATILTREKGDDCARDPFEELTRIASKHLNPKQLAELQEAAEKGADALPGEAK